MSFSLTPKAKPQTLLSTYATLTMPLTVTSRENKFNLTPTAKP